VKHDGYRTLLLVERGTALACTRNGHELERPLSRHYRTHINYSFKLLMAPRQASMRLKRESHL
jgi:hypothetical protein